MTEELPYAQEVLRFLSGDFRQRFFDIPGTPFIALTASSSALILSGIKVVSDRSSSLFEIALNHLNFLYILMRGLSLLAFGVTGWLVFLIARRFASAWAAILGAAVFALHPIMGLSLYHTRIEAFGTMLTAAAVLSLCRATETEQWRWFSAAGFIAGAAMAARFPLVLAAFPPLLFYTLARPTKLRGRGTDIDLILVAAFLLIVLLGMALSLFRLFGWFDRSWLTDLFFVSVAHGGHKLATGAIGKLWTVAGAASLGIVAALLSPLRKLLTERYARTSLLTVSVFFPIGVFVGVPTIFAGHDYLLGSIQMFIERNAFIPPASESGILPTLGLYVFGRDPANQLFDVRPFLLHSHYLFAEPGVLFNVALAGLFCAGLVRRPPKTWLYLSILFGCAVGVLSQFGKLQTTRHIAGWLPFFCVVIAVGADFVHEKLLRSRAISATLGLTFVLILYWQDHVIVGVTVRQYLASATLQRELDTWLRSNVPASDVVYHACCEVTSDVALSWMLSNGVDIPPQRIRSGSQIWFGQSSTLRAAQDGYVVTSRLMYPSYYLAYYAQMNPAEAVDPYHDPHFSLRHVIGNTSNPAANKYDVFHFSYLDRPRPPEGGISVEQATYGRSCVSAVPRSYRLSNGNATAAIARMCNRWEQCDLSLSASLLGDPAPFCAKNFDIDWVCPSGQKGHIALSAEAIGKTLHLSCLPSD
jgi:4-amino-4-deoxy-L-arabinose transferase-like glycosyltransferase